MKIDVDTALKDIADFYIKNRREMTEPELETILKRHCESEAEVQKFVSFLETEPGQLRFKTLLRERKEEKPSTLRESESVKFKPGEIVKYKGESVRVSEQIGDQVNIFIPSRQELVWVSSDKLERIAKMFELWDRQMQSSLGVFATREEAEAYANKHFIQRWREWIEIREKPSYLKGSSNPNVHTISGFKIPTTRVSSLGFVELELPVARAVEALVNENPWSSGFHGALNQRWTIVFRGKISGQAVKAARAAGLEVSYRELLEGSGQFLTDVSLPAVGVSEIEKATQVFNRFAELYESKPSYLKETAGKPLRKQTLFDDTYKGTRYTYGLTYRPVGYGQVPDGWIIHSDRPNPNYRFGTIDYPEPLSQHEIESFQLTPVSPITPEVTAQPPQGKLVQRSYRTPVGIVVDFGIQIGDTVYEPRASAVSPLGVSEAKKGWREVTTQERENYRGWEKRPGKFGNRARAIADIENRWDEIIAKGKTSQEHGKEQLASYESYMKRRAEAERQYSLKSSDLIVGMALEEIATGNRYVITEITDEGWVYARPENKPTESGGSIGKGEVRGYRLAIQKVAPEVEIPKAEVGMPAVIPTEEEMAKTLSIIDRRPKKDIEESKLRKEFGNEMIDSLKQRGYVTGGSAGPNPPLLVTLKGREVMKVL